MSDGNNLFVDGSQPENGSPSGYGQNMGQLDEPGSQPRYGNEDQPNYGRDNKRQPDYSNQPGYGPDYNSQSNYGQDYNSQSNYGPDYNSQSNYGPDYGNQPGYGQGNGYYGQPPSMGFGIASLVCGILALVTCCVWCLSIPLGVVSIVLGIVQLQKKTAKGMAIAGIVCSAVGVLLAIVVAVYLNVAQRQYMDNPMYNEIMREIIDEMYDQ